MRLLAVLPRYGDVLGGAETALRSLLATCADGHEIEIATTCATDHHTWANDLPAGTERDGDWLVHRFRVTQRPPTGPRPPLGRGYLEGVQRLASSVWSRDLHGFLVAEGPRFELLLLSPYLYGVTFWGAQAHPGRSVLVPCLHDEPEAHLAPMRALLAAVRGCILNSDAEASLAYGLSPLRAAHVVGLPFAELAPLPPDEVAAYRARHGLERPYLVYCGRIEEGKRVDRLCELVAGARDAGLELELALAGTGPWRPPTWTHRLGFLSEHDKRLLLAGAAAFATASVLESFSLVVLEAWRERTPSLSDAACAPIAEHVRRSGGGGREFHDQASFVRAARDLLEPGARAAATARGAAYVRERYNAAAVRTRFRAALDDLAVPCASSST